MNLTDEQFAEFLAALPQVRTAETEEEREAIFAFRYAVYIQELGYPVPTLDHIRRRMHDAMDDEPYTTLIYTADDSGVTGTTRICHWEPGRVPAAQFQTYSMERFKGIERLRVGEMVRVMVRPDQRNGLTLMALAYAVLDIGKPDWHLDLLFCDCLTGLIRHYAKMGWRRYAGRMIPSESGILTPLVLVFSDVEHFRTIGSFLAPLGERAKLRSLDTAPFAELFDERNVPVQFDKELVRGALDRGVAAKVGFLSGISAETIEILAEKSFVIQVPSGELLTQAGIAQRELFIIIDGEFDSFSDGRVLRRMYPGEVVGEVAFFRSDGRRSASVRCIRDGRVLVLRQRMVDELRTSAPSVAIDILFHLARTLAYRVDPWQGGSPAEPGVAVQNVADGGAIGV